jgi:hypothetical protein
MAAKTNAQVGEGFGSPLLTLSGDTEMSNDATDTPDATPDHSSPVLSRLTRAQVFARDPEETTQEDIDFIVAELRKINERNRKARADDAAVAEGAAKIKKANAVAKKKKDTTKVAANILDTQL